MHQVLISKFDKYKLTFDCEPPRLRNFDVYETSIMIDCLLVRYAECGKILTLSLF
jgi:hypothetical protein